MRGSIAHLDGANLESAKADFTNFARAFLPGVYLAGASLRGADLSQADLRGAIVGVSELQHAKLTGAKVMGADLDGTRVHWTHLSDLWKGCALIGLQNAPLEKDELRNLALNTLPYVRNAMEAQGLRMGVELAGEVSLPVSLQGKAANTCNAKDVSSPGDKARWFDDQADYRRGARGYLVELACENEAIAHGIARNFREMWKEDAATAARALLARVGKCRGLKNPSEQVIQGLEDDARGLSQP